MTRNVFIIAAPLSPEQAPFYNGVKRDVSNFYNYFRSPMGGAFYPGEIHILENPDWPSLVVKMLLNRADYSIVVFSGHGYAGIPCCLTKLKINERVSRSALDIARVNPAKKQLFIVDSCRNYFTEKSNQTDLENSLEETMVFTSELDVMSARHAFEVGIRKAKEGLQVIYSCSPNEPSKISESGSYFSKSLFESVMNWAGNRDVNDILLGSGAHKMATNYLRGFTRRQTPHIEFNNGANFPFAVKKSAKEFVHR
jgi:hypothetical protein